MNMHVAPEALGVAIRTLTADAVDDIYALYADEFRRAPLGFLARHDRDDFARLLQSENYSAGAYCGGRLVGYQLFTPTGHIAFDAARYQRPAAILETRRVLFGKGTIIAPGHRKTGLAKRLIGHATDLSRRAGYRYHIGELHVANLRAINLMLGLDRAIIGLSTDEFGTNFISCRYLGRTATGAACGECRADDLDAVASVLEKDSIVGLRAAAHPATFIRAKVTELDI